MFALPARSCSSELETALLPASLPAVLLHGVWSSSLGRSTQKSKEETKEHGRCLRPFYFPKPSVETQRYAAPWDFQRTQRAQRSLPACPALMHFIRHAAQVPINAIPSSCSWNQQQGRCGSTSENQQKTAMRKGAEKEK